jgi:Helicase conserved C-terminal domain
MDVCSDCPEHSEVARCVTTKSEASCSIVTVSTTGVLIRWLSRLDEAELAALLSRRPDVLLGAQPRDLGELAERMRHPMSLVTALRAGPLPCVQVAEAAQALGEGCTRADLAGFLTDSGPHHRVNVDRIVDRLIADAVFWTEDGAQFELPDGLADIFPSPLGLGQPLRALLNDHPVEAMRRIQSALGLPKQKNRAETLAALVAHLGKAGNIRAILAKAPADVSEYLATTAGERMREDELIYYDPRRYRQQHAATQWAGERGLMIDAGYGYDWQMPAEVARALRGPEYHPPFSPHRPEPATHAVDRTRVESDSAAAATQFADQALAVLDHVARVPVPSLKSGGIGTRELTKLAKVTAAGEAETRLTLELADAVGLLDRVGQSVPVSAGFAGWRADDPADRFVALLSAWWKLGSTPTERRDPEGKPLRALARPGHCESCRAARVSVIQALAGLDGATDRASLLPAALWHRPFVHIVAQDEDDPLATVWREAELLGVISQSALSELGRVLLAGDRDALHGLATRLLPKSADHATFGADFTVYVAGAPSARVSRLLDSAADREGRGGAVIWRFTPASVRRALDEGTTGDALITALTAVATAELPQPLRYLVADVARRHGNLRLTSAVTCIRSIDEALLAEVAADRKLAKLGLRLLAPTVLTSDATVAELLAALRAAGYFPMSDDSAANVTELSARRGQAVPENLSGSIQDPSQPQIRRLYPEPRPADPRAVAATLLRGRPIQTELVTPTEHGLVKVAKSLSTPEIRQLAHAIDTKSRVRIDYESGTGGITRRVIDRPELSGNSVYAWCELRKDEQIFTVARIRSVVGV